MKKILLLFSLLVCGLFLSAQIRTDAVLSAKLAGKSNFQDIKSTVINYYYEKLATLGTTDSGAKKAIIRHLKMWNREFWINENYTNAAGETESASKVIIKAFEKRKNEAAVSSANAQPENWVSEGPEYSDHGIGRIDRIAFHPTNPLIMYAGSPYGGLFKTINGGIYWTTVSQFVASLGVSGIAIDPANANTIYVLSGDGESNGGCFAGSYCLNFGELRSSCNGVYKSTNGGDTWQKLPDFPDVTEDTIYQGRQLLIDPTNPQILYAATSRGLFKTTNGGNAWADLTNDSSLNVWDVKFKPGNSNVVYITGNNFFSKSENGAPFVMTNIPALVPASRVSMAVTAANPEKVMLLAGEISDPNDIFIGVFTSTNSGNSFTPTYTATNIFNNYIGTDVLSGQVVYNSNITISRTNQNIVYVGGLVIWKSTDAGSTWNQATAYWHDDDDPTHPYIHPDNHHLAINPINNKLYCCNDGGIYTSSNEATAWDYTSNGLSTSQFYHFEVENDEGNTWGGCQDNGIQQRVTGLQFEEYHGGDGYDVMTDNDYRVADGEGNNVYFSVNTNIYEDDGLGGFNQISTPNPRNYFFGNLAMSPLLEDVIYAGYQDTVWKSIDAGSSWFNLGNTPGNWSIATCPTNQDRLYAAGTKPGFAGIKRYDGDWLNITTNLLTKGYVSSLKITDIEVNKLNADSLFITVAGTKQDAKVFSTSDAGLTWNNLTFNLPNIPLFCAKQDEVGGIYVGTSVGVYYKRNGVNYWEPFYNGLPPVPVTQIELYANNNRVQICTFGRGLWTTAKYGGCTDNLTLFGLVVGRNYWEVSNNIISTQTILNSPGTSAILSAGNKIIFKPGTHIVAGTRCKALIKPCGSEVQY